MVNEGTWHFFFFLTTLQRPKVIYSAFTHSQTPSYTNGWLLQFRVKCLAKGHNDGLGGSEI